VRSEMKRVSWPTFEDVRNTTVIVLINVVFFAVFLFLVDQGWGYTIRGFDWAVGKLFGAA
jgi:preprotein translocase subunit SecE